MPETSASESLTLLCLSLSLDLYFFKRFSAFSSAASKPVFISTDVASLLMTGSVVNSERSV